MDDYADGMRLKNTLSHEVRVTQTSRSVRNCALKMPCSQVVQLPEEKVSSFLFSCISFKYL